MDSNSIKHSIAPPARPPMPSEEKLAALRERQQGVKASLGGASRKIAVSSQDQTRNLSLKVADSQDEENKPMRSIKERMVEKFRNIKPRLSAKMASLKESASRYNEARKEWQKAPREGTRELGKMAADHAREKLKNASSSTKKKMSGAAHNIKELYGRGKAGVEVWKSAKKEVTLAVMADLYDGANKKTRRKTKALTNYVVKKADQAVMKLSSLINKIKSTDSETRPQKTLLSRKCENSVSTEK